MRIAICYTRFSPRPDAGECKSNEKQEERCRAYCLRNGYHVAHCFGDAAISGGQADRPGLEAALRELKPGMVFVVDSSDRLARDLLINLTTRARITNAGGIIEFADGSPNTETPEGVLMQNILAAFAEYERARIAMRTKVGLKKKKDLGQHVGRIPIGYQIDSETKKLTLHGQEQKVIKYIRSLDDIAWKHAGSREIAEYITDVFGLCRGKKWSQRSVRRIRQVEKPRGDTD